MGCCASALGKKKCTEYKRGDDGIFICDGKCGKNGTVWGSGPYTSDSSVCQAARHAGVIEDSGIFKVEVVAGQNEYHGSNKNGVDSKNYGSWEKSIVISKLI